MNLTKDLVSSLAVCAALWSGAVAAQQYPSKPVRVITPFASGSGPDSVLRMVGDKLSKTWGHQVIVENRPGGNGFIAIEAVKKAPPDGYTLTQLDDSNTAVNPHLFKKVPYDMEKDFEPVAGLFRTYFFVVVPSNSPWKSMPDLINAAKAKKGELTYGSWFVGSPGHLGGAMLEHAAGVQMTHIPFKEQSQMFAAIGNGDVNLAFGTAASSGAMFRANKVKYLAVAAPKRIPGFTDVPTVSESGGPANFEVKAWVALYAPRGTPKDVIAKINADVNKALAEPDIREKFAAIGFEPFITNPDAIAKLQQADSAKHAEMIKRANISPE